MKTSYTALVVDDERLARKDLISLLQAHPQIKVVAEADMVSTAKIAIENHQPDVIFLDIQMPGESGFDLINQIQTTAKIIFVTAYDEFAIRAFEVNVLDYLLKPVNPERLAQSLERLEPEPSTGSIEFRKLTYDDRLFLMLENQMRFIKVASIIYISAAGDYSELYTRDRQNGLTLKSMKEWEQRLPQACFSRIHRSTIINLEYVERLEEWFNYAYRVWLKGVELPLVMSRRYVAKLKQQLG